LLKQNRLALDSIQIFIFVAWLTIKKFRCALHQVLPEVYNYAENAHHYLNVDSQKNTTATSFLELKIPIKHVSFLEQKNTLLNAWNGVELCPRKVRKIRESLARTDKVNGKLRIGSMQKSW